MKLQLLQIDPKSYQGSDFGYILVKYAPDQYHFARKNLGEDKWNEWVEPVLRQYTFVVALAPALAFFLWLLFARILDIWPFSSGSRDSSGPRLNKDGTPDTSFKYKYKR